MVGQQAFDMDEEECESNLEDLISLATLHSIAKLGPNDIKEDHMATFLGLAARARESGRHKQALDILESLEALPQGQESEELAYNLGRANLNLKRFGQATASFKRSLIMLESEKSCDPLRLTSTVYHLAQSLQGQGKHSEAVGHLRACLKVHRDRGVHARHAAKIFMKLGHVYFEMGEKQESISCTFKSLELDMANLDKADKDNSQANHYNHIGDLFFGMREYDRAAKMYEKSMELQSKPFYVSWLACKLGSSNALGGNDPKAVDFLERGLEQADLSNMRNSEPRYLMSLKTLIGCYQRLSKASEARAMLESIVSRKDTHVVMAEYAKVLWRVFK